MNDMNDNHNQIVLDNLNILYFNYNKLKKINLINIQNKYDILTANDIKNKIKNIEYIIYICENFNLVITFNQIEIELEQNKDNDNRMIIP